jgi:hypothetical protein
MLSWEQMQSIKSGYGSLAYNENAKTSLFQGQNVPMVVLCASKLLSSG